MKKIHDFCADNTFLIAFIAILVVIAAYVFNFHAHNFSESNGDWGTFGDFFGGTLNPLLSFLALIILLRTFSMQKTELDLQREELKDTKELLRLQTQTQIKQRFESTFFALLNVHNQVLQNFLKYKKVECNDGSKNDFFENIFNQVLKENDLKTAKTSFETGNPMFGHYFRILYQLLRFIFIEASKNENIKNG